MLGPFRPMVAGRLAAAFMLAILSLLPAHLTWADTEGTPTPLLTIDGAIGPAQADYVVRGIGKAAAERRSLVVLRIDTPGGLDTSMRAIVKAILASPVPVVCWVAPGGARAASAGTYILYACHVAAMAPGTNLGAATPVRIGLPDQEPPREKDRGKSAADGGMSALERKQINDAAAYIRGLAQLRGRNADWAEKAVREGVSLSADEALRIGVIDVVAAGSDALLGQIDGRKVRLAGREQVLHSAGAGVADLPPDWRTRLLVVITDPGIALLLMTVGIYGLVFEFMNPGLGLPGVIGAICLLLALYALQLLPVNYAGMALILLGLGFMAAEAFLPTFGVVGLGGVVAFVAGALILIDTELPGYGIPPALILSIALTAAALLGSTIGIALRTRRRPVAAGLPGTEAEAVRGGEAGGWVTVGGETWQARSSRALHPGGRVRIVGRQGLTLVVVPKDTEEQGE